MMSQGKVHAESSYCKKISWSYYEKPLQKEMTFANILSLPSEAAHSGHPTGSSGGYAQRIHLLLSDQISQLVAAGITDTNEVRKSLRCYVTNTLCKELGYQAKQRDCTMYPTTTDIQNHVYSAKKALELSKLDQENTHLKIDQ